MIGKIDHIGVAVRSMEAACKFYEDVLGLVCEREHGCRSINETSIEGAGGKQVASLHPKSTFVLITDFRT